MPDSTFPLQVVSVSLGSSSRDHKAETELLGHNFLIERRGTGGDMEAARRLIAQLDGKVAAIGLGGIDLYVVAGARRYILRDAARLARAAKTTPVVDGSGLKDTLERETIQQLQNSGTLDFRGQKTLLVSAVDRFGMAEALVQAGADVTFGDFHFILGLPIPLRRLSTVRKLGALILPVATKLPFKMLYPTGEKQDAVKTTRSHEKFYAGAQIIAGDFLLIRRFLPARLDGKTILTNTVTARDIELLRERGAKMVITTTPEFGGRSFGTNVMEGVFAALGAKSHHEYSKLLRELNWKPRVVELDAGCKMQDARYTMQDERPAVEYKSLEIYQLAHALGVEIHRFTFTLPRYELNESGSQLRRASKSVSANIVEGYGRRRYKADFLRFLIYAQASCDETKEWLEYLRDCHASHSDMSTQLLGKAEFLSRKLNTFIQGVIRQHQSER